MRILHTSDWHIGRSLHNHIFDKEFELFVDWLIQTIEQYNVDILIIAGDIFDIAFPSTKAQELYFSALEKIAKSRLKHTFIISGNHDSASFLEAPKNLLKYFNISITSKLPQNIDQLIHPIPPHDPQAVFISVPYLRPIDILNFKPSSQTLFNQQKNISDIYLELHKKTQNYLKLNIPVIATGHLFVTNSFSDQDKIQLYSLGGLLDVPLQNLKNLFSYLALGHVHTPIDFKNSTVHYSGNPFPTNFSSSLPQKRIIIFDSQKPDNITSIPTPLPRHLPKFQGSIDEITSQISNFSNKGLLTPALAEVIITQMPQNKTPEQILQLINSLNSEQLKIINTIILPQNQKPSQNQTSIKPLQNLSELELFSMFIDELNPPDKQELINTFKELVSLYQNSQNQ